MQVLILFRWIVTTMSFLLLFLQLYAQQQGNASALIQKVKLKNITIDDGLSQGYVSNVLQDKTGYLWIATADGLDRYDGYEFIVYKNTRDSQSVASNSIKKIFEDSAGRLWISFTHGGLDLFDKSSGKFNHIIPLEGQEISTSPEVFSILGNYGDGILIISKKTLYSVAVDTIQSSKDKSNEKGISFRPRILPLKADKSSNNFSWGIIPDIYSLENGRTWILDSTCSLFELKVDAKLNQYSIKEHKVPIELVPAKTSKVMPPFYTVDNANDLVYFQQYGNVYRLEQKTGTISLFMRNTRLRSHLLSSIDHNGNIWMANDAKLYFIDVIAKAGWFIESADEYIQKKNSSTTGVSYVDHSGNIWICTLGYGLLKINLRNTSFHYIKKESESNFSTKRITKNARGDFYIVPWEGEDCFFDTTYLRLVPGTIQFPNVTGLLSPIKQGHKISIYPFVAGSGTIPTDVLESGNYFLREWSDTYILLVNPDKSFVTILYKEQKALRAGPYLLAANHQVWFVTGSNYLRHLNLRTGEYQGFRLPAEVGPVRETIAQDRKGNIWLSAEKGVCMYDVATGKWRSFIYNKTGGLLPETILSFFFPDNNSQNAWIGFAGKGLCRLDITSGACQYFTMENGLPNDVVYGILQDKSGNLWISTNRGISSFNIETNQFRNYTFEDGLQSNEFNRYSFAQTQSGFMLFGGVNGLNYFNPAEITTKKFTTAVWLTDIYINGKAVVPWAGNPHLRFSLMGRNNYIKLNYDENVITFRFALSDLTNPQQNQFSYKLQGIDENWSRMSNERDAVYTYLPPGDYVFRVKAINRDGIEATNEISFPFTIGAPWWQALWFRTLIVFAAMAIIYALYRYRLNQLLRLQAIRNRISADMHDEIGSTLSSISFYSQALLMQNPEEKQKTVLEKIKNNAQDVQEGLSDIVWSVKADMDSFENLLIRMRRIGVELLEPKNITFHFEGDEKLKHYKTNMVARKNFYLIFKEALHNAAKYAQCNNVWVSIKVNKQSIVMTIKDDGKGFDIQNKKDGNGLGNMRQRAVAMKGELTIQSQPGQGTDVTLFLKIRSY